MRVACMRKLLTIFAMINIVPPGQNSNFRPLNLKTVARLWIFLSSLQEVCFTMLRDGATGSFFTVMRRGGAEFFFERPAEMRQVFEAAIQGDLRNVERGIF